MHFLAVGTVIMLMLWGCSTQKNKMLNRRYHSLNTQYNVLFNGKEAFKVGQSILEQANDDNFFEFLRGGTHRPQRGSAWIKPRLSPVLIVPRKKP